MRRLALWLVLLPALAGATDVTIGGNTYTLQSHPRVYLDGSAGTITARIKDPDGAGASVAPQATDANPAFVALKNDIRACAASPTFCSAADERAIVAWEGALDWYMDNSQTDSRDMAIHWLNNVETWVASSDEFACDVNGDYCGRGSWSDWPGQTMMYLAGAYTLVQSEMSAGERTAFYQKMFNDDTAGYEDGCTNQLQRHSGGVATFTSGGTAVTGSGFTGLSNGDRVYIRANSPQNSTGGFATISTVNDDTSITLTSTPTYSTGGNAASVTSGRIYKRNAWSSTTCGLTWMIQHHLYAPADSINRVTLSYTASFGSVAASITVNSTAGLPAAPFYIKIPGTGEVMRVTAINSLVLSVDRGQLNTSAAASQTPPQTVYYSRYIPNIGTGDYGHNLVIQKLAGILTMALAVADEGANATNWVTRAADSWLTRVYPKNQDMWTGFTQAGSSSYESGRQLSENYAIVAALKNIPAGGSPSLDKSGGNWLANVTEHYLYTLLPSSSTNFVPWGQPDIAVTTPYSAHQWPQIQTFLQGESSNDAKYWNYWQRSISGEYTSGNLLSGANERNIPFALMYWQESDTSTDYRSTLATQKAFNVVDGAASNALSFWVSRQGFSTSTDTLVFANAFSLKYTQDHIGTGAPGAYKIFKSGWQLSENGATDTGSGTNGNMVHFAGAANMGSTGSHTVLLDRSDADTASPSSWAFARINSQGAYTTATGVTRALRHLVHFKKDAAQDYLVVYDTVASSSAKLIGQNLNYDKTSGVGTMTDSTLPSLVWTGSNRRLSTTVLLPTGTDVASVYTALTDAHRLKVCTSTDGATCSAALSSAEFLMVHRPSTSTSDVMPTVALLGTIDADFVGVQIEDASAPNVAVFAKAGLDQVAGSFTTTHSGTARYVVSGIAAGTYDVVRDGVTTVLNNEVVAGDGVLSFESVSGAFTIAVDVVPPPPDITISTTTPLSNCVRGNPCTDQFTYSGGTPPVTWSKLSGTYCVAHDQLTASTGVLTGVPTTVETCTFTMQVEDSASPTPQTASREFTKTIAASSSALSVQVSPGSNGATVSFRSPGLDYHQVCTATIYGGESDPDTGLPIELIATGDSLEGLSTRLIPVWGLAPSTTYTAVVACGDVANGQDEFTTAAAIGGVVMWRQQVKPSTLITAQGVAKVSWYALRLDPATVSVDVQVLHTPCTPGPCTADLELARGGTYTIVYAWEDAADVELLRSSRPQVVSIP